MQQIVHLGGEICTSSATHQKRRMQTKCADYRAFSAPGDQFIAGRWNGSDFQWERMGTLFDPPLPATVWRIAVGRSIGRAWGAGHDT